MSNLHDITNKEDIKVFVDQFYACVQKDDLIGPIFNKQIGNNWNKHLEKMYSFWNTVLFSVKDYSGQPFPKHMGHGIQKEHFDHRRSNQTDRQTSAPILHAYFWLGFISQIQLRLGY